MRRRGRDSGKRDPIIRMLDRGDNIGALMATLKSCGATLRFYGQPVTDKDELKRKVLASAIARLSK